MENRVRNNVEILKLASLQTIRKLLVIFVQSFLPFHISFSVVLWVEFDSNV